MWMMFVYKHAYKYAWDSVYRFSQFIGAFDFFFSGNKRWHGYVNFKLGTQVALNTG